MDFDYSRDRKKIEHDLKKLKSGAILFSHESLEAPFKSTIILLCQYSEDDGSLGLVCNYPSHMPLHEVFDDMDVLGSRDRAFYIGGPVEPDCVQILHITENPVEESVKIADNVYAGGHWDFLTDLITRDTASTRIFLGYTGWSPGQLEEEIQEGAWEVYTIDVAKFLTEWEEPPTYEHDKIRLYLNKYTL